MTHGREEIALEPVRFVQGHVGLRQLIDLEVEIGIHFAQTVLHADQIAQHAVEGVTEILEFVAGLDLAAHIELAGGYGVADLFEVFDRFDNDIAYNHPATEH